MSSILGRLFRDVVLQMAYGVLITLYEAFILTLFWSWYAIPLLDISYEVPFFLWVGALLGYKLFNSSATSVVSVLDEEVVRDDATFMNNVTAITVPTFILIVGWFFSLFVA